MYSDEHLKNMGFLITEDDKELDEYANIDELSRALFNDLTAKDVKELREHCKDDYIFYTSMISIGCNKELLEYFEDLGWKDQNIIVEFIYNEKGQRRTLEQLKIQMNRFFSFISKNEMELFFDNEIYNPATIIRFVFDDYGKRRSSELIKELIKRYAEIDDEDKRFFHGLNINDPIQMISLLYDERGKRRDLQEIYNIHNRMEQSLKY